MRAIPVRSPQPSALLRQMLVDYVPVSSLWLGKFAPFDSEQSARWQIRQHRAALAEAGALAIHRGKLLVNPQLFVRVIEKIAIEAAQQRARIQKVST